MLRLIVLSVLIGIVWYQIALWRSRWALSRRSTRLADPQIGRLTQRMARHLDLPDITVHVYEVEQVNGLAAPDGRIFLTRGFLRKYEAGEVSAEELASVIAHELGHVALGHSRRRAMDMAAQNAIRVMLLTVLRVIPFGWYLAEMLVSLLAARLSRQDEFEADAYAAALLTKAGIGVRPQITLFRKLARLTGQTATAPAWLMSHPKTDVRIRHIEDLATAWA